MQKSRRHARHDHPEPETKSGDEFTDTGYVRTAEVPFFAAGADVGSAPHNRGRSFSIEIRHAVVLDDSPDVRRALERMLSSLPCLVHCASDVSEACELVRAFQPDLALVDVFLGRRDRETGLHALRAVRELAPELVIGAISGAMNATLASECIQAGADWGLAKPFRKGALLEAVCSGRRPVPMMLRTDLPMDTIKQVYFDRVMDDNNGNKSAVARVLGKRRTTVQRMTRRKGG